MLAISRTENPGILSIMYQNCGNKFDTYTGLLVFRKSLLLELLVPFTGFEIVIYIAEVGLL